MDSRLITWIVDSVGQQRVGVLELCQSSRLVFRPSRLIHGISRLILCPGLAVSFSGSVSRFELDSGFFYSEAVIVRINEVCLGLGEFYGL